jgi:hypothetical protein
VTVMIAAGDMEGIGKSYLICWYIVIHGTTLDCMYSATIHAGSLLHSYIGRDSHHINVVVGGRMAGALCGKPGRPNGLRDLLNE